ncbi:hypothetical protein [Jiella sp. M17.18]|uniref:DUF6894 family protein n=1 Tax=Jiella sp. M17.18 TaxID=3234247 RepID=UPI0034DF1EFC
MPRFFFDINDNGQFSQDEIGVDCDGEEAVRKAAIEALPTLARDVMPDGDHHVISVLVRDAQGTTVLRSSLTLDVVWLKDHEKQ